MQRLSVELRCVHLLLQTLTFAQMDFQSQSLYQMTNSLSPVPTMLLCIVLDQLRMSFPSFLVLMYQFPPNISNAKKHT